MREGRSNPRVEANLDELRQTVQRYEPHTDAHDALYAEALSEVADLEVNREFRLVAVNEGIPYIVWVVLVVGGALTVGFTCLNRDGERPAARRGGRGADDTRFSDPPRDRCPGLPL
jgi:hypothetical protein